MFREIILQIFRNTRLCVTFCGIMYPDVATAGNIVGALYKKRSLESSETPVPIYRTHGA